MHAYDALYYYVYLVSRNTYVRTYVKYVTSHTEHLHCGLLASRRKRAGVGRSGKEAAAGGLTGCSSDEMRGPASEEGR